MTSESCSTSSKNASRTARKEPLGRPCTARTTNSTGRSSRPRSTYSSATSCSDGQDVLVEAAVVVDVVDQQPDPGRGHVAHVRPPHEGRVHRRGRARRAARPARWIWRGRRASRWPDNPSRCGPRRVCRARDCIATSAHRRTRSRSPLGALTSPGATSGTHPGDMLDDDRERAAVGANAELHRPHRSRRDRRPTAT